MTNIINRDRSRTPRPPAIGPEWMNEWMSEQANKQVSGPHISNIWLGRLLGLIDSLDPIFKWVPTLRWRVANIHNHIFSKGEHPPTTYYYHDEDISLLLYFALCVLNDRFGFSSIFLGLFWYAAAAVVPWCNNTVSFMDTFLRLATSLSTFIFGVVFSFFLIIYFGHEEL